MNAPTCVWNPMDAKSPQQQEGNQQQWWRPAPMPSDRAERPSWQSQGRDTAEMMDSFRMNLRQAKHALTVRDEEARKLRLAVTHLEGVLSLRERELRDTQQRHRYSESVAKPRRLPQVKGQAEPSHFFSPAEKVVRIFKTYLGKVLCLHGKSLPRQHQEWLQEGTSKTRLRLQVHRLQRTLAMKQDHIQHLKRQASLGFLREAREQADEYRIEATRLSRALAAAKGGVGRRGELTTSKPTDRHLCLASGAADGAWTGVGVREGECTTQEVPANQSPHLADALYPRVSPFRSQTMVSSSPKCFRRGEAQVQGCIFDESNCRREPSLAWDAGEAIQTYFSRQGTAQQREMPLEPRLSLPLTMTSVLGDVGSRLLSALPPTRDNDEKYYFTRSGRRPTSSQRRNSRASTRIGRTRSRGWNGSPEQCRAVAEKKRLGCMAASARLRAAVRQSALEHREVLALSEESRRLEMARAERARRARVVQQRIVTYREERIRELERRLERRCGVRVADIPPVIDTAVPFEAKQRAQGNSTGKYGDGHGSGGEDAKASTAIGTSNSDKLQPLSKGRREISAAIGAKMEGNHDPGRAHHEPPRPARRKRKEQQEQDVDGRRRQWQVSGSRADSALAEDKTFLRDDREQTHGHRTGPSGKPPLAPSRAGGRRRPQSAVHRRSNVSEVAETVCGRSGEEFGANHAWGVGDCENDVDEVRTEAMESDSDGGTDARWRDQRLSDEEDSSVWEESIPSREWEEDRDRGAPRDGQPPALLEVRKVRVRGPSNHDNQRRRHRSWAGSGDLAADETNAADVGSCDEPVTASDARSEVSDERDVFRSGRKLKATRKKRPIAGGRTGGRERRSSPKIAAVGLRAEGAAVGNLSAKKVREERSQAHKRDSGVCFEDVHPESAGGSAEIAANNLRSRGRRRRRRDESGRVRIDDDRLNDPISSLGRGGEMIDSTRTNGNQEEGGIVDRDMEDDCGSCSSRWSLSAEDEPLESKYPENASPTRQLYHRAGNGGEGSFAARTISPDSARDGRGRRRKASVDPESEEGAIVSGSTHAIGMMPEYADDFSEESRRQDQDNDVAYGVSSPSDEEQEAFAAAEEDPDCRLDEDRRGQHRPHFDTNTASNQRLVEEPPLEPTSVSLRQDDGSSAGGHGRPGGPQPAHDSSNDNQVLLQPVSPPVLRQNVKAVESRTASAEVSFLGREGKSGGAQPLMKGSTSAELDSEAKLNGKPGSSSTGKASTLLHNHGTRNYGHSEVENGSEAEDAVTPMKIDSAVLFASLSASTAGASLSSKSMARAEGSGFSARGAAAGARQPRGSTSTFALSVDDSDDVSATHGKGDDNMAGEPSPAGLNAEQLLEIDSKSIGGNISWGVSENAPIAESNSKLRELEAPSTPMTSTSPLKSGHDGSTGFPDAGPRPASSPSIGKQQAPSSRADLGGVPDRIHGFTSTEPLAAVTTISSGTEPARSMLGDQAMSLLDRQEKEQPQGRDKLDPNDSARNQNEGDDDSVEPLTERPRFDEGSGGTFGEGVESESSSLRREEDHVSGDAEGGITITGLEIQPSQGGGSSHSGSVLDVGGGDVAAAAADDDDDGYF